LIFHHRQIVVTVNNRTGLGLTIFDLISKALLYEYVVNLGSPSVS
jgi:hypothetical protein